ncbi:MAG: IPT/TIG domain-containing protein, partial [Bacteroidetes bacterium]|nr:IPT/TIG domain-containing protein [Bacteroidota bacterium]
MKTIYSLPVICICWFAACKKTNSNPSGNGGNGGNNGGQSDTLSVTSFSPAHPYSTDEVTITGTGFNPDKTKDSIYFNTADARNFGTGYATITQASATQIKFIMPPDSVTGFMDLAGDDDGVVDIKVIANGKSKLITKAIKFKMKCQLYGISIPANLPDYPRPDDTLFVEGRGWSLTGTSLSINGQAMNLSRIDSSQVCCGNYATWWFGYTFLPKTFFGEINNEDTTKLIPATVTNADGSTDQKMIPFFLSPMMRIDSITIPGATFVPSIGYEISKNQVMSSGGNLNVAVFGKNLKSWTIATFGKSDGFTATTISQTSLGVSGFPDNTSIPISAG